MEITQDAEPDFSNARTLHFCELLDRKDEEVRSIRDDFDTVYRVTTVKGVYAFNYVRLNCIKKRNLLRR
ncbi:hypothetical protein RF55_5908 [Lasius niger]|uniref:Uncharacterized protein n=1 Tax=Lasius niger TaxID=67767 RepID=A0A0J7KUM4_LASNI|nr:hypothetical protein RF55_5908 [Lasius niger]